jgi:crotonobetainyl-CoA:carnitine CoA-transferase CaiB-like acyl-CoA transferase
VFCREFGATDLAADSRLQTNTDRVAARPWLLKRLETIFGAYPKTELEKKLEAIGLPYAPITRPRDLFDDPHLNAGAGMIDTSDPRGHKFKVPGLPLELDGERLQQRRAPPALGEGSREILLGLGYSGAEIERLGAERVVALT